ncbi:hypothetical protein HA402_012362 [Bradysia odoriphaga]|nr:hypothetical protein HA402_012362 [Bradysia odoriphaga]
MEFYKLDRSFFAAIQESFSGLETEFKDLIPGQDVPYTKFRKHFVLKCGAMFFFYIISIFAMIMSRITDEKFVSSYMVVLTLLNDLSALETIFFVDLSKYFLKTITYAFRADRTVDISEKFAEEKFVKSMKRLHLSVWKTVDKINEYFGLFLLGYIIQQFLMISYDIYWIFLNKFDVGIWLGLDNGFVLISDMLSFFFLSNSCHKLSTEADKIRTLLYDRDDCLSLPEGQVFLSQILNQPIKIGAKGFYKLDQSFFAALTVGSMTSAIILVQFQFQTLM